MTTAVQIPEDWYPPRWQLLRRRIESRGNTFLMFRTTCPEHEVVLRLKGFGGYAYCPRCLGEVE